MTPEETDKKIEFILQMQAQFEANLGKLEGNLARSEHNIDKLRESQATLTGAVIRITELLEQSQRQSDERFARLDERLAQIADVQRVAGEAQKTTDERLNALIDIVEKHITGPDHRRKRRR